MAANYSISAQPQLITRRRRRRPIRGGAGGRSTNERPLGNWILTGGRALAAAAEGHLQCSADGAVCGRPDQLSLLRGVGLPSRDSRMSSSQPPATEPPPLPHPPRPFFPGSAAYSLDLLKAYSELREPTASPPPVSADSSGSPPKPATSSGQWRAAGRQLRSVESRRAPAQVSGHGRIQGG